MEDVLIFGIGGFVGPYLADEFLHAGYRVFGSDIVRSDMLSADVPFYQTDLLNPGQVAGLVGQLRPSVIVNLAAVSSVGLSWKIPQKTVGINVVGALNILEAARAQERKPRVMFIGSSEEYEPSDRPMDEATPLNANNPYGISKVTQERFAEIYRGQYGMEVYCVRPFNHTGVGQRDTFVLPSFCRQAAEIERSGKPGVIKVGNLSARRDFSHVKDVVRAYRMIVESGKSETIYNVGSGKAYSLTELLEYITSLCSQKVTVEVDAERFRPIDNPVICCDNTRIRAELGWVLEHDVFEALREIFMQFATNN